jgi:hypothetical protein
MTDFLALARHAYAYAEQHYSDRDARFDVIVETMEKSEIAQELEEAGAKTEKAAIAWAKRRAGLHHEQELNAAWDGPESVKSSSRYDPAHDPAGPWGGDDERAEARQMGLSAMDGSDYDASDAPPYGNIY